MVLPSSSRLKTLILEMFVKHPTLRAETILSILNKSGKKYTIQAVYKELRHLIAEGALQHINKTYTVNGVWALQLQAFSNQLVTTAFKRSSVIPILKDGETTKWHFNNLLDMNDFWGHVALHLIDVSDDKNIFAWNPHLWFWVVTPHREERFYKSLSEINGQFFVVVGGKNFLNMTAAPYFKRNKNIFASFDSRPFRDKMNTYYNVIGDYIITVRLHAKAYTGLDRIFSTTTDYSKLDLDALTHLLIREGNSTFQIEKNAVKAKKLKQKFLRHFDT